MIEAFEIVSLLFLSQCQTPHPQSQVVLDYLLLLLQLSRASALLQKPCWDGVRRECAFEYLVLCLLSLRFDFLIHFENRCCPPQLGDYSCVAILNVSDNADNTLHLELSIILYSNNIDHHPHLFLYVGVLFSANALNPSFLSSLITTFS